MTPSIDPDEIHYAAAEIARCEMAGIPERLHDLMTESQNDALRSEIEKAALDSMVESLDLLIAWLEP